MEPTGRPPLTPMSAVIGKNGVGKSALFDAFGFLADALRIGVEDACDARGRGGFSRLHTQGHRDQSRSNCITGNANETVRSLTRSKLSKTRRATIREVRAIEAAAPRPEARQAIYVSVAVLRKRDSLEGRKDAGVTDESDDLQDYLASLERQEESWDRELVELSDRSHLGIATLGSLKQHPRIAAFRRFIEGWYLSYFSQMRLGACLSRGLRSISTCVVTTSAMLCNS